jgi:hypothetical protein
MELARSRWKNSGFLLYRRAQPTVHSPQQIISNGRGTNPSTRADRMSPMAAKSRFEQIADFVERWSGDRAGRYEVLLVDGQRIVIQDCYLSYDLANRPDHVWVNHDSHGYQRIDFDPLDVVSITDLEQCFEVIPASKK